MCFLSSSQSSAFVIVFCDGDKDTEIAEFHPSTYLGFSDDM